MFPPNRSRKDRVLDKYDPNAIFSDSESDDDPISDVECRKRNDSENTHESNDSSLKDSILSEITSSDDVEDEQEREDDDWDAFIDDDFEINENPDGEKLSCDDFTRGNVASHIALRKNLFILLSRSCQNPTDIQDGSWLLPGDKYCRGKVRRFPKVFYDTLKDFFLHFFGIQHPELDVKFNEDFVSLDFLKTYDDVASKKKLFKQLAQVRQSFLGATFHKELKEALIELRTATYSPPEPGTQHGTFIYRKRGRKRNEEKGQEQEQEEEHDEDI